MRLYRTVALKALLFYLLGKEFVVALQSLYPHSP